MFMIQRKSGGSVISETADHEAIIINLLNGKYHRIQGLGSEVWDKIDGAITLTDLCNAMQDENPLISQDMLIQFLFDLHQEDLIDISEVTLLIKEAHALNDEKDINPLKLESFDDMADLLLLDPIHEVGAGGWPQKS